MPRQRDEVLMKRYGITQADFDRMKDDQGGLCLICNDPPCKRGLFVDHCHKTKEVRGLLCHHCNSGLGYFKDKALSVWKAFQYLTKGK